MKIFVTHSSDFDFKNELYDPLRLSKLNTEHDIKLPQEQGKETITKDLIKEQDLIIAETSYPSTGSGIELGWADTFDVPIVSIYRKGSDSSSSVRYVTKDHIEYTNSEDLIDKLSSYIRAFENHPI